MWSLPNIRQMNARKAAEAPALIKKAKTQKQKIPCEYAHHPPCQGRRRTYLVYDIFSDDPSGTVTLCEKHDGYFGSPAEELFECVDCGRIFYDHITWERYVHEDEDGSHCLNCYAKAVIANKEHPAWIDLTQDREVIAKRFEVKEGAQLPAIVKNAPHIIAVDGPRHGLVFQCNTEFDSYSGSCISGNGAREILDKLCELKEEGHRWAIVVMDGAYQFAVSIAVYTEGAECPAKK